jgi:hypothetical protein
MMTGAALLDLVNKSLLLLEKMPVFIEFFIPSGAYSRSFEVPIITGRGEVKNMK